MDDAPRAPLYSDVVRILVAGFEPWGSHRRNPSGEVARAMGGHVLPVRYDRAERAFLGILRRTRPAAVVLLGLAEGRKRISLEAVALNVDHCENGAWRRWRRPIARGPFVLSARLPLDRLHRRLRAAGIPVSISYHAGTFSCNHVFYLALSRTKVPCGFVHLPPERAMGLKTQRRAVELILQELRKQLSSRPRR